MPHLQQLAEMCYAVLLDEDTGGVVARRSIVLEKIDKKFICDFYKRLEEVHSSQ